MKNPLSGDPSPFSSSTHDPNLAQSSSQSQPVPVQHSPSNSSSNVPGSVQQVGNAQGWRGMPGINSAYQPSGKVGSLAFPFMLVAALIAGALAGTAYYFIAPFFNFILATQAYLGAILAVPLWLGIKAGKVRSQRYAAKFAVLATLVLFVGFHAASVWRVRETALDFYTSPMTQSTKTRSSADRAMLEQKLTYVLATQLYWEDLYTNGVTLTSSKSSSSSSSGIHVTGIGYLLLLLFEIVLTMIVAAAIVSFPANARFSESQNRWYSKKRILTIGEAEIRPVLQSLRASDWENTRQVAKGRKRKGNMTGYVFVSTVPGEPTGWVEMSILEDKQQRLVFEAEVDTTALRAIGAKI